MLSTTPLHCIVFMLVVISTLAGRTTAAAIDELGVDGPKPTFPSQLAFYTCQSSNCQNCSSFSPGTGGSDGNCYINYDGSSSSMWIYPNKTLETRNFKSNNCSGEPFSSSFEPTNKCISSGSRSMFVYYNSAPPGAQFVPAVLKNLKTYTCADANCHDCSLEPGNPKATYNGNCEMLNGRSSSTWVYASNQTLQTLAYATSDCSGSPDRVSYTKLNKCIPLGGTSAYINYDDGYVPAVFTNLKTYICADANCQDCSIEPRNPKATYNGNCETLNGHSTSEWIYTDNNTLQTRAYAGTDCSGNPVSVSNIHLGKCIPLGSSSVIVKYGPPNPAVVPALVKNIKAFVCNNNYCFNYYDVKCNLQKLSTNVTVRGNCAMWKNQGYSMSYYLIGNAILQTNYFEDNTLCTGQPTKSSTTRLDTCNAQPGDSSEIIYYTGDGSTTFDGVPFVTTEEFSFTKNIKKK